jgi:hypothetical protein
MIRRNLLALLLVALAVPLYAQTQTPDQGNPGGVSSQAQGSQGQSGAKATTGQGQDQAANNPNASDENTPAPPSSESHVPTPLPLSIDANMLEFSPELAHTNFLNAGVSAGASYDTNLLSSSTTEVGGAIYTITPTIGLNMSRPRLLWTMDYSGGYLVNQRYSGFNQASHSAGIDIRYRLSPHVNFRVSDRFLYTGNFLSQLQGNTSVPGGGVITQPNQAVITPIAQRTDNLGTVEITYQYSAGDMVGASGTFYNSHFGNVPAGSPQLLATKTEQGSGFYTHRFTPRNWTGIAYNYQRLNFNPDTQSVQTHSFYLFHTIYLQPRMQLALFAGPEYSDVSGQVVVDNTTIPPTTARRAQQSWSTAGGASFSWQGLRTGIRASGVRKVSDGGGLLEAVTMTTVNGGVRRQLTRSANIDFSVVYGDSTALQAGSGAFTALKSVSGSVGWEQRFGRNFSANLGYARDYQQQNTTAVSALNINHNRGWITLAYQFSHPLGR